jgi:hypothetical protein
VASPTTQALTCPKDAEACDLDIVGTLISSRRDALAKWDNLEVSAVIDSKRVVVYASINIPNRARLKLKAGTRYRFQMAAHKLFGAGDLWVVDAKPR